MHKVSAQRILQMLVALATLTAAAQAHAQFGYPRCGGTIGGRDGVTVVGQDAATGVLAACTLTPTWMIDYQPLTGCNATTPAGYYARFSGSEAYRGESLFGMVVEPHGILCAGH